MTDRERVQEIMEREGVSAKDAAFILAAERNAMIGDIIEVNPQTGEERQHTYTSIFDDRDGE